MEGITEATALRIAVALENIAKATGFVPALLATIAEAVQANADRPLDGLTPRERADAAEYLTAFAANDRGELAAHHAAGVARTSWRVAQLEYRAGRCEAIAAVLRGRS